MIGHRVVDTTLTPLVTQRALVLVGRGSASHIPSCFWLAGELAHSHTTLRKECVASSLIAYTTSDDHCTMQVMRERSRPHLVQSFEHFLFWAVHRQARLCSRYVCVRRGNTNWSQGRLSSFFSVTFCARPFSAPSVISVQQLSADKLTRHGQGTKPKATSTRRKTEPGYNRRESKGMPIFSLVLYRLDVCKCLNQRLCEDYFLDSFMCLGTSVFHSTAYRPWEKSLCTGHDGPPGRNSRVPSELMHSASRGAACRDCMTCVHQRKGAGSSLFDACFFYQPTNNRLR